MQGRLRPFPERAGGVCRLDVNLSLHAQNFFILLQNRTDDLVKELLHLLLGSSRIAGRIHGLFKLIQRQVKGRICSNKL
jgi:hypothetical protein